MPSLTCANVKSHQRPRNAEHGNSPLFHPMQMAAIMNDLFNMSELVGFNSLVKGATYRILTAHRCMSPQGVRLFLKLRTHPHNVFVKLPHYCVNIFSLISTKSTNTNSFSTSPIGANSLTAIPSLLFATKAYECLPPHKCGLLGSSAINVS